MKIQTLKTILKSLALSILLSSCGTYEVIGKVDTLSDRHINASLKYKQLTTNSGSSKKEILHSEAVTVRGAVTQALAKIPGGCFMTDVTVYAVNDGYFAVSGNVWVADKDTARTCPYFAANYKPKYSTK